MRASTPAGPAERAQPPRLVSRVCMNGHLVESDLSPAAAGPAAINRADPLAVATTPVHCQVCHAGTIVGCPGCGYPIPGRRGAGSVDMATLDDVPHFCIVCGEYYPWTFRAEFYATLAEIVEEAGLEPASRKPLLETLARQREGLATGADVEWLVDGFSRLGGSDWDLAAQILAVVLPPRLRRGLDLRGAFAG
ncbi:MAG TPA: DUF2321 domain-containing protein [Candidatus Limnocylindrales bacterium]